MGVYAGPDINENGLILAYDETNPKTGTNKELVADRSAGIVSETQRDFAQDTSFATTYSSVAQYNSLAPAPGTGFSFSTWVRRTNVTTGTWNTIATIDSGGPRYRMLYFGWFFNQTSQIHCSMPYYSGVDTAVYWSVDPTWVNAGLTFNINQWYNFTATYSNSSRLLSTYINGIFALSATRPGLGDLNNPAGAPLRMYGCNNTPNENSQLTSMQIYNKELTADEVRQNFNALRGRYGY